MCRHITVILRNSPGQVLSVAEQLKESGINICAFHLCSTGPSTGYVQIACSNHSKAMAVLTGAFQNYAYDSEVLAIRVKNVPGSLASLYQRFAEARVNIENSYQTLDQVGSVVVVVEPTQSQLERAKSAIQGHYELLNDFTTIC